MKPFTQLFPKDLMKFFGLKSYEAARRLAVQIRDMYDAQMLTVRHLAKYLGVSDEEIIIGLK